jgi:ABC-type uncharacterized transport system substrate-binding protein
VLFVIKRLALGMLLIAAAAAVLLISDLRSRRARSAEAASGSPKVFRVAMLQHISQAIMEETVRGVMDGLREQGLVEGGRMTMKRFVAEGDVATANAIAKEMVTGEYDLLLTLSTPSLQAVANANREGKTRHIFGLVSDPYAAGIGANRTNGLEHPRHLTGYGSMQPIANVFRTARECFPALKTVGVIYNPGEANAEAQVRIARDVAKELGITLVEVNADNSPAVLESANTAVARGAQALWVCGDNTVITAFDAVVSAAKKGKIPVLTVSPSLTERGALFDLGADFFAVGKLTGVLAGEVLNGRDPATVPIENVIPEALYVSKLALADLKDPWTLPPSVLSRAGQILDASGKHRPAASIASSSAPVRPPAPSAPTKMWKLSFIELNDVPAIEESAQGILAGLKDAGLVEGASYQVKRQKAQGDAATLATMVDAALTENVDMIVPISTLSLQTTLKKVKNRPIVFAQVTDPIKAGAGKSFTDHLPHVTGSSPQSDHTRMIALLRQCLPNAKKIATLFNPSEDNSVIQRDGLAEAAKAVGIEVQSIAVNSPAEIPNAAVALTSNHPDAICQISDNLTAAGFPGIVNAARKAKLPLFCYQSAQAESGAPVAVARDFFDAGRAAGTMAAKIIRGENPAKMPFEMVTHTRLVLNPEAAKAINFVIPTEVLQKADALVQTKSGKK